jgi:hypothetical protein
MKFALGQAVPRTEDPRLLTGRGRYIDDFVLPRLAHACVLRSPHAHARIHSIDVRAAQQIAGVLAVLTGEDWATEKFGAPRPIIPRQRRDGSPMFVPSRPALAKDRAMLVGDPVALPKIPILPGTRQSGLPSNMSRCRRLPRPKRRCQPMRRSSGPNAPTTSASSSRLATRPQSRRPSPGLTTSLA